MDISRTAFTDDGTFSPGNSLGALLVTGNLPQRSDGTMNIQLGGTNPGINYDQLKICGNAILKGTLNITLVNGFNPAVGQTFEIIDYGSSTGSFDSISGLELDGGFYLFPVLGSTNLTLTVTDSRPRPEFSPPQALPDGDLQFPVTGVAGTTFEIQATTNLLVWDPVLTVTNPGAVYNLIIIDSTNYPYRFYLTSQ